MNGSTFVSAIPIAENLRFIVLREATSVSKLLALPWMFTNLHDNEFLCSWCNVNFSLNDSIDSLVQFSKSILRDDRISMLSLHIALSKACHYRLQKFSMCHRRGYT